MTAVVFDDKNLKKITKTFCAFAVSKKVSSFALPTPSPDGTIVRMSMCVRADVTLQRAQAISSNSLRHEALFTVGFYCGK